MTHVIRTPVSNPPTHNEYLDGQDLMELMGVDAYNAVKAAPLAQYFVDIGTALNAAGKKVWVKHPAYIYAVGSFLAAGLIDQPTHDRMLTGVEL